MTQRIRILQIFGCLNRGGAELRTLEMARALDPARFTMDFLSTSGRDGELDCEAVRIGGSVHKLALGPRFASRFQGLLREAGYTAVHSHVHHFSGYIARLAARSEVPLRIVHFRTTDDGKAQTFRRSLQRRLMKCWIQSYATHILGVSNASLDLGWSDRWRTDPRCSVIYNGLDLAPFSETVDRARTRISLAIDGTAPLCLHVGRMDRAKNHERLLAIFSAVHRLRPDAKLLLAGGGDENMRTRLESLAASLGLKGAVTFAGSRNDIPALMAAADVLVFPSVREGLPGVLLEACAAGLPVIASSLPGSTEIAGFFSSIGLVDLDESDERWANVVLRQFARGRVSDPVEAFRQTPFVLDRCAAAFDRIYSGDRYQALRRCA